MKIVVDGNLTSTFKTWNDTVANLTLMALGRSAPEIFALRCGNYGGGFIEFAV